MMTMPPPWEGSMTFKKKKQEEEEVKKRGYNWQYRYFIFLPLYLLGYRPAGLDDSGKR